MRLYIGNIADENNGSKTYDFTESIGIAWHWTTRESAELAESMFVSGGITAKSPDMFGRSGQCTDFQIEPGPQGRFVISCECPL
jgi:hypothetical protein